MGMAYKENKFIYEADLFWLVEKVVGEFTVS